jgi:hypothetical protein
MSTVNHTLKIYDDGREVYKLGPLSYTGVQYTKELIITVDADASAQLLNLPSTLKLLKIKNLSDTPVQIYANGASDKYDLNSIFIVSNVTTQFRVDNSSETAVATLKASYVE